ncbi:MAG: hypothetical protein KAH22_11900 [Thiotrichaceae bacterium]|nr:hypothetical protein [Thiotrichaceae bacterium]
MNIILFCLPIFGKAVIQKLVDQGTPPAFIVGPAREHPSFNEMLAIAHSFNLPVLIFEQNLTEKSFNERMKELSPDLIMVASYSHIIPRSIFSTAKIAAVNAHPSLLPNYRGAHPCFHVVKNGEQETGVTLHLLDDGFDTGSIIKQVKYKLKTKETMGSLEQNIKPVVANTIADFVKELETSGLPETKKQAVGSYLKAERVKLPLDTIDWDQTSSQIDQLIRATNPHFLIKTQLNNKDLYLFSGRPVKSTSNKKRVGEIEAIDEQGMRVSTSDGAYLVTSLTYPYYWHGEPLGLFELGLIQQGECFSCKSE